MGIKEMYVCTCYGSVESTCTSSGRLIGRRDPNPPCVHVQTFSVRDLETKSLKKSKNLSPALLSLRIDRGRDRIEFFFFSTKVLMLPPTSGQMSVHVCIVTIQ